MKQESLTQRKAASYTERQQGHHPTSNPHPSISQTCSLLENPLLGADYYDGTFGLPSHKATTSARIHKDIRHHPFLWCGGEGPGQLRLVGKAHVHFHSLLRLQAGSGTPELCLHSKMHCSARLREV